MIKLVNYPQQEEKILRFWKEIKAFEKSVEQRPKSRPFVFYEGPPTANGRPGIHHILARAFKDVICRYKTMRGYRVERKGGWDTHGLPVEIEVEKNLGLKNKRDIERYGIGKFNEECHKSVWKYQKDWEKLTERMGYWIDLKNPYITYDPLYMETLWWIIKRAWDKKLFYEGHKVVPFCPRCGTSLSSHEVAQGYEDVKEESVYVKFKVKIQNFQPKADPPRAEKVRAKNKSQNSKVILPENSYFLAWTTTPWTLPGNVALAVGPNIKYVLFSHGEENYIVAEDLYERVTIFNTTGSKQIPFLKIDLSFTGKELVGIEYEPVFNSLKDAKENKHYVVVADFVSTEEGTGIVHTAVMYGEDDYKLGDRLGLPKIHTVNADGTFNERVPQWKGIFVKDAEKDIIADLGARNLLYKTEQYTHSYPFCWRCKTPLLYYAMNSWFIEMSSLRKQLIANNKKVGWTPSHIRDGRFGEWLREVKDWAFSRARYWGTPLPIWKCEKCGAVEVIGSRDDLRKQTFSSNTYYLLRHGHAQHNDVKIISSRYPEKIKMHLTEEGKKEARKAAEELKRRGGVDMIFSSPFTRTKETAEIVGKALGVRVVLANELRELATGGFDGRLIADYLGDFPTQTRFFKAPVGGETLGGLAKRMNAFVSKLEKQYQNKRVLIVGHGDPLWMLENTMAGRTQEEMFGSLSHANGYPHTGQVRPLNIVNFPYNGKWELDFHRPYVDSIVFHCAACRAEGSTMRRVKDLADVWFDSGAMPFAQSHWPFAAERRGKNAVRRGSIPSISTLSFPADYICEAIDQTRGWFYTLLAVSAVLGYFAPYKNVISLGHVLDKKGEKMSKSRGNIVDPWSIMNAHGVDALRWYFYTSNNPGDPKRFDEKDVQERRNKFIGTLWNTLVFFETYMYGPPSVSIERALKKSSRHALDVWIRARLEETKRHMQKCMDAYAIVEAARAMETFVMEDLSNWYVRRSRRRFQKPRQAREKEEAAATLAFVLWHVAHWSAPFIPFMSEEIFQRLRGVKQKESVHWQILPRPVALSAIQKEAIEGMNMVRELAGEGLRLRNEAGIRVRQPLQTFFISRSISKELAEVLMEELNVKEIAGNRTDLKKNSNTDVRTGETAGSIVGLDIHITPQLRREGLVKEMVRYIQDLRKAAGLKPRNHIKVTYVFHAGEQMGEWHDFIAKETSARSVERTNQRNGGGKSDADTTFSWDGEEMWIGIRKVL